MVFWLVSKTFPTSGEKDKLKPNKPNPQNQTFEKLSEIIILILRNYKFFLAIIIINLSCSLSEMKLEHLRGFCYQLLFVLVLRCLGSIKYKNSDYYTVCKKGRIFEDISELSKIKIYLQIILLRWKPAYSVWKQVKTLTVIFDVWLHSPFFNKSRFNKKGVCFCSILPNILLFPFFSVLLHLYETFFNNSL